MINTEFAKLIIHITLGFFYGYVYSFLNFKKRSFIKDSFFSLLYISLYFILIDKIFITTHPYLILIMFISFMLTLKIRSIFKSNINNIYYIIRIIYIFIKKILIPPIILKFRRHLKKRKDLRTYYKKFPYLKKSKYELF